MIAGKQCDKWNKQSGTFKWDRKERFEFVEGGKTRDCLFINIRTEVNIALFWCFISS